MTRALKFGLSLTTALVLVSGLALAQQHDEHEGKGEGRPAAGGHANAPAQATPARPQAAPARPSPAAQAAPAFRGAQPGSANIHPAARPAARAPVARAPARNFETHDGPRSYQRPAEPQGWNSRPATADRSALQHNYHAARSYHVGPYHRPSGWVSHRWAYGQILPRAYWASRYVLSDYYLFALEIPPVGYEWVRDDDDAILVNIASGEILQVEYGVFA